MADEMLDFTGHMKFVDRYTCLVHSAGFKMETFPGGVGKLTVWDNRHGGRPEVQWFRHPVAFSHFNNQMCLFRDVSGVLYFEEARSFQGITCPDCQGRGGNEGTDGSWIGCPTCHEDGMV